MDTPSYRRLINTIDRILNRTPAPDSDVPELEELFFKGPSGVVEIISEAWVKSQSGNSIRIEPPKHGGGGQVHGHIYGRQGQKIGAVNLDGTGSHGTKMRLNKHDAAILQQNGFSIRSDRMVEWVIDPSLSRQLLLG